LLWLLSFLLARTLATFLPWSWAQSQGCDILHPTVSGFSQCICDQAIDSIRVHLLRCVHGGTPTLHRHTWCSSRFFRFHCEGCSILCFMWANTCFLNTIFLVTWQWVDIVLIRWKYNKVYN
jgi:hypothetical protein